jgi:hypothetical protein
MTRRTVGNNKSSFEARTSAPPQDDGQEMQGLKL